MDDVMKMIVDMAVETDISDFFLKNSTEEGVKLEKMYFAHTVFINNDRTASDEEYRIVIDSSIKTPHNKFFVDVLANESMGIINGWSGSGLADNFGRCVEEVELLSDKMAKEMATLDEIKQFIDKQNKENNTKGPTK